MSPDFVFEFQRTNESKGKGLKEARTNLTLKGGSKVNDKPTKIFGAHDFQEVVFTSQTSKANNKGDTELTTPFDQKGSFKGQIRPTKR